MFWRTNCWLFCHLAKSSFTYEHLRWRIWIWQTMWQGRKFPRPNMARGTCLCSGRTKRISSTWCLLQVQLAWIQKDSKKTLRPLGRAHPVVQQWKNPPPMQETQEMPVWSLGREDPLEKEMQATPIILAWKNLMDREAWPKQSMGSEKSQKWLSTTHNTFPWPALGQVPSAVKVQSPNQWTARERPMGSCLRQWPSLCCLSRDSE